MKAALLPNTPIAMMISNAQLPELGVEAGKVTKWHSLENTTERYVIVTGKGLVEVGADTREQVVSGDVVIIPAGVRQRITNTGIEDLVFLAICTPRFQPENYTDLE